MSLVKKAVVIAAMLSLMIAIPVGIGTALVTPDEVTITEERCIITTDGTKNIVLGYYYMYEHYHYESRLYAFDDEGYPLYHDVRVHDSWEERESTITTFNKERVINYWLAISRAFLRCDGEESNEFSINRDNFYIKSIANIQVTINNEAMEDVTYSISPLMVGFLVGIIPFFGLFIFGKNKFIEYYENRTIERQRTVMKREYERKGYREY